MTTRKTKGSRLSPAPSLTQNVIFDLERYLRSKLHVEWRANANSWCAVADVLG